MKDFFRSLGILRPFFRGLPIIALVMVVAVMAARRYLRYTTPMYESTAKIKLADTREGIPNSNLFKDFDIFANSNKIAAEVELLKSKALIGKALQGLGVGTTVYRVGDLHKAELYHQSPFIIRGYFDNQKLYDQPFGLVVSGDSVLAVTTPDGQQLQGLAGREMAFNGGRLLIISNHDLLNRRKDLQVNDRYEFVCHSMQALAGDIIGNMDVMSVDKEVPVLRISYKSPVPAKSADVVNAVAAAYIADYINEKFRSADTTVNFLSKQLSTMSGRLAASENEIEAYRNQENIINIRQETETDLRKISDLKKQLASVQMNLLAIKDLNLYIDAGRDFEEVAPNFEAFTDLLSTELVKKMKELKREKRDLLLRYTPDNDKVKVVDDKLGDIEKYLRESIHNTERNLQIKYDDLQNTITEAEEVFIGLPGKEKNMTIKERNFSLNEQIYRFLHEKRTEAEIARAATMSFHRVIAEGEVPRKPVSPNATLLTVLAGFLGFLFGVMGVYAVHFLKARINEAAVIQKNSETPLMAEVPYLNKRQPRNAWFLRWAMEMELKGMASKGAVIVLSSFDAGEGKRFNTAGLCDGLQQIGKRCVVLDADGTMPSVPDADRIGVAAFPGQWMVPDNWRRFLASLREQYDVVLVKNLQVAAAPAGLMIMACADTNLFIMDSRITRQKMIMQADLMKDELKLPGMYFVLNRAGYTPNIFSSVWRTLLGLRLRPTA